MNRRHLSLPYALIGAIALLILGGCARVTREANGTVSVKPAILSSSPRAVVENYLKAASQGDGAEMYALIASSERKDETPESLKKTAIDRYSPSTSWEILKVEEKGSTADVVVDFQGAKVDPNPYRFTLTREAGEWRIVQSPELHETDRDSIKIKL